MDDLHRRQTDDFVLEAEIMDDAKIMDSSMDGPMKKQKQGTWLRKNKENQRYWSKRNISLLSGFVMAYFAIVVLLNFC